MTIYKYCSVCRNTQPMDCPGCSSEQEEISLAARIASVLFLATNHDPGEYTFGCDES